MNVLSHAGKLKAIHSAITAWNEMICTAALPVLWRIVWNLLEIPSHKKWPRTVLRHWSNKPKEYRNSNDMMGCFLRTGFVWVRHVNKSHNFDPGRRLGDKCKEQLAEPSQELLWLAAPSTEPFLKQQPFPKRPQETVRPTCRTVWGTP